MASASGKCASVVVAFAIVVIFVAHAAHAVSAQHQDEQSNWQIGKIKQDYRC
jgi:hypothetical protein